MTKDNSNPGLDALWRYVRSLPPTKGEPMDNKLLKMAHEAGFNTEHPATNEYLRRFAELVREDCAKVALQGTGEPVQTHTLEILKAERERIATAIRSI